MNAITLGEVLELLHTSEQRWSSLRAEGTEWRDPPLLTKAFMRAMRDRSVVAYGDPEIEPPSIEPWRLWIRPPSTFRAEFVVGDETVSAVIDGDWWWSISPSRGARTNGGRSNHSHGLGPGDALFRFHHALGVLFFDSWDGADFGDRPAVRAIAHPITAEERTPYDDSNMFSGLHGIGTGADEYELIVDFERGALLRAEARLGGRPFRVLHVSSIAFDEVFASDIFRLKPPPGTSFTTV